MQPVYSLVGMIAILLCCSQAGGGQNEAQVHVCRHPDNGIEQTYTASVFVDCVPKANQCAQIAAQSFKPLANVRFIKGFADPFLRPWDANGNPNRCDPQGNANVPCWAQTEIVVYKRAANKKCKCDSD
jgi:hypothetical protein